MRPRKSWTEVEPENDWGRGVGRRQREKPPAFIPLEFLKLRSPADGAAFLTGRQNVNLSADVKFPVVTKEYRRLYCSLQHRAWFVLAQQQKFITSILDVKKICSSKLQIILLRSKRTVSEREIFLKKEETDLAHLYSENNWYAFVLRCVVTSNEAFVRTFQSFDLKMDCWNQ